jgi:uncharacterized membrane protein
MKKQTLLRWTFILAMISIPWLYLAVIWSRLPERIPVHFGINGAPDKYGEKNQIFITPVIVTVASLLIYLLLTNIYKIDPKKYALKQRGTFLKIAMAVIVFMSCIGLFVLHWTATQHTVGLNLFLVMMGLLFAYIGNVMHTIKPNYFAGFRLPWTLESEENWKATHMLVSKLWFGGGILIAILALFIKPFVMFFVMLGIMLIMIVIPVIYSYKYFKKEKARRL